MTISLYLFAGTLHNGFAFGEGGDAKGEAAEGGSTMVMLNGVMLPRSGLLSSDFSEMRIAVMDVADALALPSRWDADNRVLWLGNPTSGSLAGVKKPRAGAAVIMLDGKPLPPAVDPLLIDPNGMPVSGTETLIGSNVMAVADELAKELGMTYQYDAGNHRISLLTSAAKEQFENEEAAVRDVLESKGMEPHIAADGTKEFTLTAELHDWAPVNGVLTTAWTFNGQAPGPTIRVTEGDKVRITFVNNLNEPSTIHWHGLHLPNAMDGIPDVTQKAVQPGQSFVYEFTASHPGTFMYHPHYDDMKQIGGGMYGAFIIDPKTAPPKAPQAGELSDNMTFDHDYTMLLAGFRINNAVEDEPDYFTINGRSYPDTPPIRMKVGETARVRLINIDTAEVHTMHLHGIDFQVIARNGHAVPYPETMNTVMLGPGETVDIAFRADSPGDWMLHCHILDHTMNGGDHATMGAEMGGLMTLVRVTE